MAPLRRQTTVDPETEEFQRADRPALVDAMTPPHPVWSARAVVVDPEYSVLDALMRDNVSLVTAGIERIEPRGVVAMDGTLHEADVVVYASGFHATEYLYPMTIVGRDGLTLEELWKKDGARAYLEATGFVRQQIIPALNAADQIKRVQVDSGNATNVKIVVGGHRISL